MMQTSTRQKDFTIHTEFSRLIIMLLVGMLFMPKTNAQNSDPHLDYQYHCNNPYIAICAYDYIWVDTIEEGAQQQCDVQYSGRQGYAYFLSCTYDGLREPPGWPAINLTYTMYHCPAGYSTTGLDGCDQNIVYTFSTGMSLWTRYEPIRYFSTIAPFFNSEPNSCCENPVAEPIDPSNGTLIGQYQDMPSGIGEFRRFYNSTLTAGLNGVSQWGYSYARRIISKNVTIEPQPYASATQKSSLYTDGQSACSSGFAELQAQVPSWAGATAEYDAGLCHLTKAGIVIGSLPLRSTRKISVASSVPIVFDVLLDDGQIVRFPIKNGVVNSPPGTSLKLSQTTTGFTIRDGNDNVETYDTSGKLLSIASRAGVVQTMSYDGLGRLSSVSDNFGHQLTFGYDAQNKLISVTR